MKTRACEECARNCQLMHWNKMDLSPIVSRFFKIMIGKDFSKLLFLPPSFAETVTHLVDQETKLEDSNGLQWPVTLSSVEKSVAFQRGWHDFSLNHNLRLGDFLVFNYIKGGHFVVQIFGINGREKLNFDRSGPACKKSRTKRNITSRGIPCERAGTNVIHGQSLSTSVVSGANLGNSHIQPTTTHSAPICEGGNGKWSCSDNSFYMMIDGDIRPAQGEERMRLLDLSSFELQEGKQATDINKGIDVEEGTSNHTPSMRSEAEEDNNPIGTEDLNMGMFTKETYIGMIENEKDCEPKDDMWLECESGPSTNLLSSLPLGPSCAELGTKGNNMSNVATKGNDMSNVDIQLHNAERSAENYGDVKKIARKEKPEMREQSHGCARRLRESGPSTIKESGGSSAAPYVGIPVKLEPVDSLDDSLDMPSSIFDASACLALTDGRNYLELPAELPAIRFRKGSTERKYVLLLDKERRMWPALYYERSGFYILITGWDRFNKANGIQAGDQYIFKVVDLSESIYSVDVLRQSEGTHLQGPA